MANFKPILFSTEMVQANLEGRKTQTRRTKGFGHINKNPNNFQFYGIDTTSGDYVFKNISPERELKGEFPLVEIKCPFGQVGDVLWVRENFHSADNFDAWGIWQLIECRVEIYYNANLSNYEIPQLLHRGKTRPSIFMPKEFCRIFLKIKNIKVERLHDISEEDAIAEGCSLYGPFDEYRGALREKGGAMKYNAFKKAWNAFKNIWETINSEESWKANPWVWAIEFERIDKPNNFC